MEVDTLENPDKDVSNVNLLKRKGETPREMPLKDSTQDDLLESPKKTMEKTAHITSTIPIQKSPGKGSRITRGWTTRFKSFAKSVKFNVNINES